MEVHALAHLLLGVEPGAWALASVEPGGASLASVEPGGALLASVEVGGASLEGGIQKLGVIPSGVQLHQGGL